MKIKPLLVPSTGDTLWPCSTRMVDQLGLLPTFVRQHGPFHRVHKPNSQRILETSIKGAILSRDMEIREIPLFDSEFNKQKWAEMHASKQIMSTSYLYPYPWYLLCSKGILVLLGWFFLSCNLQFKLIINVNILMLTMNLLDMLLPNCSTLWPRPWVLSTCFCIYT